MRKRPLLLIVALVFSVTSAAWSYYQVVLAHHGAEMALSAQHLLDSLTPEQLKITQLEYGTPQRYDWHFVPRAQRKGLQLRDMTDQQRTDAHKLLRNALSQVGYDKSVRIMELETLLAELEKARKNGPLRDPLRYYFTIYGKPSSSERWGLSVEGHHLSLNFVVAEGRVVSSTPQFMGTSPAIVKEDLVGFEAGYRILRDEEVLGFKLVRLLSDEHRKTALIAEKAPADVRGAKQIHPPNTPAEGLPWSKMNDEQRVVLRQLIEVYAGAMPEAVAQERLDAIEQAGLDKIHFAWAGALEPGIGHYYRVQGPTFVIEFSNAAPDAAGNPANHIHCVWRDMRGDFGLPIK